MAVIVYNLPVKTRFWWPCQATWFGPVTILRVTSTSAREVWQ